MESMASSGDSQKSRELKADTSADVDAYSNVDDDLHPEERDDRHCAHVTLASLRDLFSCRQAGLINIRDVYLAECARVLERIMVRAHPQRNSQPIPWVRSKSWDSYTASWPRLPAIVPKQETEDLRAVSNMTELLGLHTFARKTWQPSSWPRPYRMWARTLSLGTCLSLMPCTQATPIHHKGPAENIQDGFDEAWQILLLFAPYVVSLIGLGRVLWIVFRTSREFKDPFHSRVFAFAAAFTWWIVRSMEGNDHTSAGSVILAVFLACWACFMAECRRPIRDKTQYLLSSIFSGCLVSLLITAMVFIPTFEPTKKGKKNAMAEYMEQTSNVGPIWLVVCSFATYVWQRYRENQRAREPSDRNAEEALRQSRHGVSTSALDGDSAQTLHDEQVHQRGHRRGGDDPEQPASYR